jgi:long-chain acyl-CoA synthetase
VRLFLFGKRQDRAKDLIIRGGENISCAEVESAVYDHPAVKEAAAFGLKHERLGEEVAVALTLRDGVDLDGAELVAFCAERVAKFKVPVGPLSFNRDYFR